jgi:FkbM family methyltransferase
MTQKFHFGGPPTINFSRIPHDTILGRLVRAPLRLIPQGMVVPILQGPLRGKKWIAGSSTNGCWFGTYEADTQRTFRRLTKSGSVVYDIGANVGFYTLLASVCAGSAGRVYSFEPLPKNIADLKKHIAINHLANCEVIEAAVSRADGVAHFDSLRPRTMGWLAEGGKEVVRTVCIDSLVGSGAILPPDLAKIDVEGAELSVLEGCVQTIAAHRPLILLATHGHEAHDSCIRFLIGRNYKIQSLNSFGVDHSDELLALP